MAPTQRPPPGTSWTWATPSPSTAPTTSTFPDLIVGQLWLDTTGPTLKRCTNASTPTYTSTEGSSGANTALSNLASVAINLPLLPDAAAADDFGSATLPFKDLFLAGSSGTPGTNNFKITGASTSGTRVITLPNASDTLVGKDTTDTLTNKTLTSPTMTAPALGTPASGVMTNVTGIPVGALANGTDGNLITWDASGVAAVVATGNSGQVLTSNGAGAAPTMQTPASSSSFEVLASTSFQTSARFGITDTSGGTSTFGTRGAQLGTSATGTSGTRLTWGLGSGNGNMDVVKGSPQVSFITTLTVVGTDFDFFVGPANITATGGALSFIENHIGFKVTRRSSGTINLVATQADGSTETASSALTTVALDDILDLILKINSTTSVDYYWRKNTSALSSATNLTTNMPSGIAQGWIMHIISNAAVASSTTALVSTASFKR